jgi:hypothetical protein
MFYGIFVIRAMSTHTSEPLFVSQGNYLYGKPILWLVLLGFIAAALNFIR